MTRLVHPCLVQPLLLLLLFLFLLLQDASSQSTEFGASCVESHNALRRQHKDTNDLKRSKELETLAQEYADMLKGTDVTVVIHPKRPLPLKRKRRAVDEGIDDNIHLELWDGYIEYPSSKDPWLDVKNRRRTVRMGRSIHKFCCTTQPHCPREFFHGLSFPPSASGITNDMYNQEEKYYDYDEGKSKTIYSHINHFAQVVWKNTTLVGCAQSEVSKEGCVFTIVLYEGEGAVGDESNFVMNISKKIDDTDYSFATRIVLIVFIVCIVLALIILLYCCRHKIDDKYKATMVNIDVLKAEQELETDSTRFWWTRPLKRSGAHPSRAPPPAPPSYQYSAMSSKQQPQQRNDYAEEEVLVVRPPPPKRPHQPSLKNIPRPALTPQGANNQQANASQLINRYKGMSLKRNDYHKLNPRPPPPVRPSGPLPPVPRNGGGSDPKPPIPHPSRPPPRPTPTEQKPTPVARKPPPQLPPSSSAAKKPMVPNKPLPRQPDDVAKDDDVAGGEDKPMSVSERKRLLQGNQ